MKHYYFYLVTCRISNLWKENKYVTCEVRVSSKITTFAKTTEILVAVKDKMVKEFGKDYESANISFAHPPFYFRTEDLLKGLPDPEVTELSFWAASMGLFFYAKIHQKFTKTPMKLVYILWKSCYNRSYEKRKIRWGIRWKKQKM